MALKRSVGIGAVSLCVALSACKDDKCNGPNRDAANCSSSSGHGGGSSGAVRSGSSEGSSGTARGGFGATGSAGSGHGGE